MDRIELKEENQLLIFYPNQNDLEKHHLNFCDDYDNLVLLIQIYQLDNIDTTHSYLIYEHNQQQFLYSEYEETSVLSFSQHTQPTADIHASLEHLPSDIEKQITKVFHFLKAEKDIQNLSLKKIPKIKV